MRFELQERELWWGGRVADGSQMPFSPGATVDLSDHRDNQASGVLVSNRGRVLSSSEPFSFSVGTHAIEIVGEVELHEAGNTLRDAVRWSAANVHQVPRSLPEMQMFDPQWVTWIEMLYEPTQDKVLGYAQQILDAGYKPGVLMIDDNWNQDYGTWKFRPDRFPDPASMVTQLNDMGFEVMLWVCPYVSSDGPHYLQLRDAGLLIGDDAGEPAIRRWWNGYSAVLDLTNPDTVAWFDEQLRTLQSDVGIAGFKFDGADPDM